MTTTTVDIGTLTKDSRKDAKACPAEALSPRRGSRRNAKVILCTFAPLRELFMEEIETAIAANEAAGDQAEKEWYHSRQSKQ